jgi:hypothetical protein
MNKLTMLLKDIKGNIGITFVLILAIVIVVIVLLPPEIPPNSNEVDYCRQFATLEEYMTSPSGVRYKLIKEDVPVLNQWANDGKYNHFGTYEPYIDPASGKKYTIRNPQWGAGTSYQFASDVDPNQPHSFTYAEYGIVFRFETDDNGEPLNTGLRVPVWGLAPVPILFMDIFQQVGAKPLPEYVLKCQDYPKNLDIERMMIPGQNTSINVSIPGLKVMHPVGDEPQGTPQLEVGNSGQVSRPEDLATIGVPEKNINIPNQTESTDEAQLQAEWFLLQQSKFLIHNWWAPHCKPAIYLYPPKRQLVNVKVHPSGYLIYTDPLYPEGGWNVEANPNGQLVNLSSNNFMKNYDYLYFESKVPDHIINKPTKGWVIKSAEIGEWYTPLNDHFALLLPKLGLNEIQTSDFIDYWKKALPESPYYYVGIVDQENVDQIEKLEFTPKPGSINRVRIYFERLDQPKEVEKPVLETKKFELSNTEFKVVEWGGMVKNDPNHPFTCSQ